MAINLTQLQTELGAYLRTQNTAIRAMVYRTAFLVQYMRRITKVKGLFPAINSVTDHVVQGFQAVWNPIGTTKITANQLQAYHQKVNFLVTPSQIENSWIAELNDKELTPAQRPISQYIMENELKPKVISDIEELLVIGEYDVNNLAVWGKAMNGLLRILSNGIADTDNPMYRIELSAQPTDDNIVDIVTEFEKKVPKQVRKSIKNIFMSTNLADAYQLKYEELFGKNILIKEGDLFRTRLRKWNIVPVDTMDGSNLMFVTPDGNLLLLSDDENPPTVTDIQILDYDLKIFMEWWMGVGFWSNQLVMVSVYDNSGSGLIADNDTYYGGIN